MAKEDVIKKIFGEDLLEMMIFKLRFSGWNEAELVKVPRRCTLGR